MPFQKVSNAGMENAITPMFFANKIFASHLLITQETLHQSAKIDNGPRLSLWLGGVHQVQRLRSHFKSRY
jgi:hypothetical protein